MPSSETPSGTMPAVPPIVTVASEVKPVPVIVTEVPPPTGPESGVSVVSTGAVAGAGR